jgi:hypothetical protein
MHLVDIGLTHRALARFLGFVNLWYDPGHTRAPGLPVKRLLGLVHLHAGVPPRVPWHGLSHVSYG